ncbi:hypothetical protein BHE74_00010011 [Ensete ventricosum]|nr:hypothetical protein BHE74_00010011 [Ensete ventricosum]
MEATRDDRERRQAHGERGGGGKVKKIVKLDREISKVTSEALLLIYLSADHFLAYLTAGARIEALKKKRRIIKLEHVRSAARAHRPTSQFLLDCLPKPPPPASKPASGASKARSADEKPLPPGARRIDDFLRSTSAVPQCRLRVVSAANGVTGGVTSSVVLPDTHARSWKLRPTCVMCQLAGKPYATVGMPTHRQRLRLRYFVTELITYSAFVAPQLASIPLRRKGGEEERVVKRPAQGSPEDMSQTTRRGEPEGFRPRQTVRAMLETISGFLNPRHGKKTTSQRIRRSCATNYTKLGKAADAFSFSFSWHRPCPSCEASLPRLRRGTHGATLLLLRQELMSPTLVVFLYSGLLFVRWQRRAVSVEIGDGRLPVKATISGPSVFLYHFDMAVCLLMEPSEDVHFTVDELLSETNSDTDGDDEISTSLVDSKGPVASYFDHGESNIRQDLDQDMPPTIKRLHRLNHFTSFDYDVNSAASTIQEKKLLRTLSTSERIGLIWPEQPLDLTMTWVVLRCDRILWFGKGVRLLDYKRAELMMLSDHRPVTAVLMAEVEVFCHRKLQKALTLTDAEVEDGDTMPDVDFTLEMGLGDVSFLFPHIKFKNPKRKLFSHLVLVSKVNETVETILPD